MWGTWGGAMRCRFKRGQHLGDALGYFQTQRTNEEWIVVLWDGDSIPKLHRASLMMFKSPNERHWSPNL